ncbi:MAG: class I SAM-dependent methyltransferase [Deltaproteobacteria bacterium]|nr:class I SAM-dependent methyltransferase [Deltaproteobacteria bacterium]
MNKQEWNQKFETDSYIYGKEPLAFIKENLKRLRQGKTLDIAMGEGRNSVYLASQGFEVSGFDFSEKAVQKAQKLAEEKKVTLETKVCDLDFYIFPIMKLDTIIMTYFKPVPRYFFEIKRGLCQGGTILIENYTTDLFHIEKDPDVSPDDCFKPNEVLKYLEGLRVLFYQETTINNKALVQCIAKKPFDKDALKYGFATHDKGTKQEGSAQLKKAEDLFKKK